MYTHVHVPFALRLSKTGIAHNMTHGINLWHNPPMSKEPCEVCERPNAIPVGVFRYLCFVCKQLEEMDDEEMQYEKYHSN